MEEENREEGIRTLKKMILEKSPDETIGEVLVKFCTRSSLSMDACREYYKFLVAEGEIKEGQTGAHL
jgi:hypothetical protein